MNNKPIYIAFEGIDGAGKTEQLKLVKYWLATEGYTVIHHIEPSYTGLYGNMIRTKLKSKETIDPGEIALLFTLDRLEQLQSILKNATEKTVILADRSFLSSMAYQGCTTADQQKENESQYSHTDILDMSKILPIFPNIIFYLEIEPEASLERCKDRDQDQEVYENLEYLKRTQKMYAESIRLLKSPLSYAEQTEIIHIDSENNDIKTIHNEIVTHITQHIKPYKETFKGKMMQVSREQFLFKTSKLDNSEKTNKMRFPKEPDLRQKMVDYCLPKNSFSYAIDLSNPNDWVELDVLVQRKNGNTIIQAITDVRKIPNNNREHCLHCLQKTLIDQKLFNWVKESLVNTNFKNDPIISYSPNCGIMIDFHDVAYHFWLRKTYRFSKIKYSFRQKDGHASVITETELDFENGWNTMLTELFNLGKLGK